MTIGDEPRVGPQRRAGRGGAGRAGRRRRRAAPPSRWRRGRRGPRRSGRPSRASTRRSSPGCEPVQRTQSMSPDTGVSGTAGGVERRREHLEGVDRRQHVGRRPRSSGWPAASSSAVAGQPDQVDPERLAARRSGASTATPIRAVGSSHGASTGSSVTGSPSGPKTGSTVSRLTKAERHAAYAAAPADVGVHPAVPARGSPRGPGVPAGRARTGPAARAPGRGSGSSVSPWNAREVGRGQVVATVHQRVQPAGAVRRRERGADRVALRPAPLVGGHHLSVGRRRRRAAAGRASRSSAALGSAASAMPRRLRVVAHRDPAGDAVAHGAVPVGDHDVVDRLHPRVEAPRRRRRRCGRAAAGGSRRSRGRPAPTTRRAG